MKANDDPAIVVALDYATVKSALALVDRLDPALCRLKIGKELFTRGGPGVVEAVQARGFDVFLDLKFHDIPNTVAGACAAAAQLGVWMVNVHALGGRRMLDAAREAIERSDGARPLLVGVTILTSMAKDDLAEVGLAPDPRGNVLRLARLTGDCGLDGVVCAPTEIAALRQAMGERFALVTPGVRPAGSAAGDQRRVMTPAEARAAGSDYLVIGRPVTGAADPVDAVRQIASTISDTPQSSIS